MFGKDNLSLSSLEGTTCPIHNSTLVIILLVNVEGNKLSFSFISV